LRSDVDMRPAAKTEADVLATLDEFSEAFASRAVERVMELFAADADVVFMGSEAGETAIGANVLRVLLKEIFSRPESYSWEWKWRSVSAAESVAWVTADAVVRANGGDRDLALPYRLTVVMEKRGNRWVWMQYHGSEPHQPHPLHR
jgi:ketosteroid isomerase-like protein